MGFKIDNLYFLVVLFFLSACFGPKKMRSGEEAFEFKQYSVGIPLFLDEFEESNNQSEKAKISFLLGESYRLMGQFSKSISWYKKSYDLGYGFSALEKYAFALKSNEDYEDAIRNFVLLAEESGLASVYRKEINICKLAIDWKKRGLSSNEFKVDQWLDVNEKGAHDFGSQFHPDGSLYFSSDRFGAKGSEKYAWSGHFYFDIYQYSPIEKNLIAVNDDINTIHHEGSVAFDKTGENIYFSRCEPRELEDSYCDIFKYNLKQNGETEMIFLGEELCNNVHPALHPSDTILVFSSDRKLGEGMYDLYYSVFRNGEWTNPTNLGAGINTTGNEKFPVWNKDTLYFSSDQLAGMGGLDIFKTWIQPSGQWVAPQRLPYPINSGADDYSISFDPLFVKNDHTLNSGVFCSNRIQQDGDKIFRFYEMKPKKDTIQKPVSKGKIYVYLNVLFYAKESYYQPNSDIRLDSVYTILLEDSSVIFSENKQFIIREVEMGKAYSFRFSKKGYWPLELEYEIPVYNFSPTKDSTVTLTWQVRLIPVEFDKAFVLEDVFFDFDKWDLRSEAEKSLLSMIRFLKSNPKLKIKIQSHTDCRGELKYNLDLSEKRAKSIVDFLIKEGIQADRCISEGMGESALAIKCVCEQCTEEQHQANRRSTFTLIR